MASESFRLIHKLSSYAVATIDLLCTKDLREVSYWCR